MIYNSLYSFSSETLLPLVLVLVVTVRYDEMVSVVGLADTSQ